MAVRNSESLDVFLKIAANPRVSWRLVELAGREISADAAGAMWVASEGKKSLSGDELADLLIEQGGLVDALIDSWRDFQSGEASLEEFEVSLKSIVLKLENLFSGALPE